MKNIVIALVLGAAGAVLAHMFVQAQRYIPMVTIAAPEGLTYIALQEPTSERQACGKANERFLTPIKASCKECKVVAARCERIVEGLETDELLEGGPSPNYLIVAPGLRMTIEGPDAIARRDCDSIASDAASRGVQGAACIYPKADAPRT